MNQQTANRIILLLLVIGVSALFLAMISDFLMTIFMAIIFTGLAYPIYERFERWFGGRQILASSCTLLVVLLLVLIPLFALFGMVLKQALTIVDSARPWVQQQLSSPADLKNFWYSLPFSEHLLPYRDMIYEKSAEIINAVARFLINHLSSVTAMTANLLLMTVIMLYTMFFLLMDGKQFLNKMLSYLPMVEVSKQHMVGRFMSVTRAILKGSLVIAVLQGTLAGLAFWVVDIPAPLFWAIIMAVLSFIPGVGSALVWVPATVVLTIDGQYTHAIGLAVFCGLVVGMIDNILRPRLVGRETHLHELLIFFGILGGLLFFGMSGFIVGPIVAALFVTLWGLYGESFKDLLGKNT